ncbi:MAG TPA: hypothetical protein VMU38_01345 [Candidatus Binatia bacterium]|nr:hypothetical protein [Candidatus Binatia bacterium]
MKASRAVLLVALALLALAALRDLARLGDALPWRQLYDVADFYCAGAAVDAGADPYRYEPLHRCEHAVNRADSYVADPNRVVPAPLPPYDFPPLVLLARTNFETARALAVAAIVAAFAASVLALALIDVPVDLAALAVFFPAGYVLLNAGQVVPFALVALLYCGVALARGRDALAGALAALTLIEPHLGLPVCAALVVWARQSRLALLGTALALAIAGVLTVGIPVVGEYVTRVLPAQAAAEAGYAYQYSLTYVLRSAGAQPAIALAAGQLSYAAALVLGVWLGRRAARRLQRPELLAYLPAACSIIGGPYVHMVDLGFAVPAALVLATSLRGRAKSIATVALCLLAVPWILVWISKRLFLATLAVVAGILLRLRTGAATAVATFACIAVAIYLFELAPPAPLVSATAAVPASALAQQGWADYVAHLGAASGTWFSIKVPTWIALAGIVLAALAA